MKKILFALFLFPALLFGQNTEDAAVALSAAYQIGPPSILLNWPMPGEADVLLIRREQGADTWYLMLDDSMTTTNSYLDVFVEPGKTYEYAIQKTVNGNPGFGYVSIAIEAALQEQRGKVLLFCEQALAAPLSAELNRLRQDLAGDGWNVVWRLVPSNGTVATVKAQIVADYNADPTNVKAVMLLGAIPVPYSGNTAWDVHSDHVGAWPADSYYSDMDGVWTDNMVNNTSAARNENDNVPGDGKFDQDIVPTPSELAVGRVDFSNLSEATFGLNATELMRRYLNKDHHWRVKEYTVDNKTLIDDNFGYFSGEAFAANGYRNGYAITGANSIVAGDFFNDTDTQSFLFGYGCGSGTYNSAAGVGNSANFATDSVNIVFSMLFGSYNGDWDYSPDPFLPSALASKGGILSCTWAGRPHWFFQHMASGSTIGYSTVETMNTCDIPGYPSYYGACGAHVSLLGDPTLRAHIIAPPTDVAISEVCGSVSLNWTASAESGVAGYQVYRSTSPYSGYTKLGTGLINTTTYTDVNPVSDTLYYQVRAVKMQTGGTGGSYWNSSTGAFADIIYLGSATPNVSASGGLITCYNDNDTLRGYSTTAGASFSWSGPNGFSANTQNALASTPGNYTLVVTALNGCTNSTTVVMAQDVEVPTVSATAGTINCNGPAQLNATISNGQPIWEGPNGFESQIANPTASETGEYTLIGLNVLNGCSATATVTVQEDYSVPENLVAQGGSITCAAANIALAASSSSNGVSYLWSGPGGYTSNLAMPVVGAAGPYSVVATLAATGCTAEANITVIEDTALPELTAVGATLSCSDPSVQINASSTTIGATFHWSGPGGFTSTLAAPFVTVAGNYSVIVTGANGCTNAASVTVNVDGSVPNASAIGGLLTCYNTTDTIRGVSTTPGVMYSWTGPNGFTSNLQNAVVNQGGVYNLTVIAPNGCTSSAAAIVAEDYTAPGVTVGMPAEINCLSTESQLTAMVTGGEPFWTGPSGFVSTELNPTVTEPGTYTLTALNVFSGCETVVEVEVPDNTTPPTIMAVGGTIFCENGSFTLSVISSPDVIVAWPGLPGGSNPVVTEAGEYTVVVIDQNNGCTSTDVAVVELATSFLNANIPPVLIACDGSVSPTVVAGGGTMPYAYLWSNGETTPDAHFDNGYGAFTVVVTDDNGCSQELSGDVPQTAVLTLSATATDESLPGAADGTASATAGQGTAPYIYAWSNGQSTPNIANLGPGTYTVTVTDANGCTEVAEVLVNTMVGLNNVPADWTVSLLPNPASAQARLNLNFPQAREAEVSLIDLNGRVLQAFHNGTAANQHIDFDLSQLPSGLYLVQIRSAAQSATLKLSVSK